MRNQVRSAAPRLHLTLECMTEQEVRVLEELLTPDDTRETQQGERRLARLTPAPEGSAQRFSITREQRIEAGHLQLIIA